MNKLFSTGNEAEFSNLHRVRHVPYLFINHFLTNSLFYLLLDKNNLDRLTATIDPKLLVQNELEDKRYLIIENKMQMIELLAKIETLELFNSKHKIVNNFE